MQVCAGDCESTGAFVGTPGLGGSTTTHARSKNDQGRFKHRSKRPRSANLQVRANACSQHEKSYAVCVPIFGNTLAMATEIPNALRNPEFRSHISLTKYLHLFRFDASDAFCCTVAQQRKTLPIRNRSSWPYVAGMTSEDVRESAAGCDCKHLGQTATLAA